MTCAISQPCCVCTSPPPKATPPAFLGPGNEAVLVLATPTHTHTHTPTSPPHTHPLVLVQVDKGVVELIVLCISDGVV